MGEKMTFLWNKKAEKLSNEKQKNLREILNKNQEEIITEREEIIQRLTEIEEKLKGPPPPAGSYLESLLEEKSKLTAVLTNKAN